MTRAGEIILMLLLLQFAAHGFAAKFLPSVPAAVVEYTHTDFICESENKRPIEECRFTVPGFLTKIKIFSGLKNEKYEFVGDGFSNGQCGLRLLSVNRSNAGIVKCSLVLSDNTELERETNVTVLYPVEKLNIVSNSKDGLYEYKENETMEFKCIAVGGFPSPTNLSLVLGGQILNSTSQRNLIWSGQAQFKNNKQQLECRAEQTSNILLPSWTHNKSDTRQVFVKYAPRLLNKSDVPVLWKSVYSGNEVNVTVKILANPEPFSVELSKDGNFLDVQPQQNKNDNVGSFEYTWTIMAVQQEDFESIWNLKVTNEIGNINVAVKLHKLTTTSSTPTTSTPTTTTSTTITKSTPTTTTPTTTTTTTTTQPPWKVTLTKAQGLSAGAIVAIVFGSIFILLGVAGVIWYIRREKLFEMYFTFGVF